MKQDVDVGMLFSNMVMFFIILTAGTVLFKGGIHQIDTVEQAAQALRPLAGESAYLLFALGVIGTGLLAIPVLSGSLSYIFCETFGWTEGLDHRQAMAICLVWITDSIDWAVVAVLWALAGWKQRRGWLDAAAVATIIPLAGGVGVMSIDYTFFGGWMIVGSVALAVLGLALSWRMRSD